MRAAWRAHKHTNGYSCMRPTECECIWTSSSTVGMVAAATTPPPVQVPTTVVIAIINARQQQQQRLEQQQQQQPVFYDVHMDYCIGKCTIQFCVYFTWQMMSRMLRGVTDIDIGIYITKVCWRVSWIWWWSTKQTNAMENHCCKMVSGFNGLKDASYLILLSHIFVLGIVTAGEIY